MKGRIMTLNQKIYEILAELLYNIDIHSAKCNANSDKAISISKLIEAFISKTNDDLYHDTDRDKITEMLYNISISNLSFIRKEYLMNNDYRNAMKSLCENLNLSSDITDDYSNKFAKEMYGNFLSAL